MIERLNALFVTVVCILVLPASAFAQLPSPCHGWNLGNTLEPPGGEGTWNNPPVTQAMINAVADAGFNTIRIPVAWNSHADQSTYEIDPAWLTRVQQVVDWCLDANLTVVVNTHWDGGWFENNIGTSVDPVIDAKMDAYWTQIANTFVSYDDRLLFAGANEPHADTAAKMSTLTHYYETFIDAVRGTGGNNTSRWLVVQGPEPYWGGAGTISNIDLTDELLNTLPDDPTDDRLAVEVHCYEPWQFALFTEDTESGDMFYFWGEDYHSSTLPERNATHGEEDHLIAQLQKMNTKFVSQGVPVILGEFGAIKRTGNPELTGADLDLHLASRNYFLQQVADIANSMGISPIYWDNGDAGTNGFALFDRNTATVIDQDTVDALTVGPELPGDLDGDGDVDLVDYGIIRDNLQTAQLHRSAGDLNGDGFVDLDDFRVFKALYAAANVGSGALGGKAAVPEPSSWLLAGLALIGLATIGRRRR